MRRLALPTSLLAILILLTLASGVFGQGAALDVAFRAYWDADSPADAEKAGKAILATGASFETLLQHLKAGRGYRRQPGGARELTSTIRAVTLDNTLFVPADYDPGRKWPLRVQLHGGVGRRPPAPGDAPARPLTNNRIASKEHLILQPRAWAYMEWWRPEQVDNILKLVAQVKRQYNVDESRIYISGISDGGTGTYYLAMRTPTLWSACMPLIGHPLVLANPDVGADGQLYAGNLVNCPMFAVNDGRDPLYPSSSVEPFIEMFKAGGVDLTWHVHPEAGHDTSWWPVEQLSYEQFVEAHYPAKLTFETERTTDRYNRISWLVINALGSRPSDTRLPDLNSVERVKFKPFELYGRGKPSGRVDAVRTGNRFDLKTRGVRELTLLLHADEIDFTKDVTVIVNGKPAFQGKVTRDPSTLLRWAARDDDRSMLYGAELKVTVP